MNLTSTNAQKETRFVPFLCRLNFPQQPAKSEWGLRGCWTPAKWHSSPLTKQHPCCSFCWQVSILNSFWRMQWQFSSLIFWLSSQGDLLMLCFIHGVSLAGFFTVKIGGGNRFLHCKNKPEITFEYHNKTIPLCAKILYPEYWDSGQGLCFEDF